MEINSIQSYEKNHFNKCYKEDSLIKACINKKENGEIKLLPWENTSKRFIFQFKNLTEKEEEFLDDDENSSNDDIEDFKEVCLNNIQKSQRFMKLSTNKKLLKQYTIEEYTKNESQNNNNLKFFQNFENNEKKNDDINYTYNIFKEKELSNRKEILSLSESDSLKSNSIVIDSKANISKKQINKVLNYYSNRNLLLKQCYICFWNFNLNEDITIIKNCKHIFHLKCWSNWVDYKEFNKDSCPYCKNKIN